MDCLVLGELEAGRDTVGAGALLVEDAGSLGRASSGSLSNVSQVVIWLEGLMLLLTTYLPETSQICQPVLSGVQE